MKFIVFNGSPAGENSNTNVITEAFLSGAKRAAEKSVDCKFGWEF